MTTKIDTSLLIFRVRYEYLSDRPEPGAARPVQGCELTFRSATRETAYLDAFRWFENRHEAMADHFYKLLAFKISQIEIPPLEANGYCPQALFWWDEWKIDTHPYPDLGK